MGRTSLSERNRRRQPRPADVISGRAEAIDQMNPALRRKLKEIEKESSGIRETNIRYYHELGRVYTEIGAKPEIYGENAKKLLAKALHTHIRACQQAALFHSKYSEEEMEAVLALENEEAGFKLHWGHVRNLLSLPTKSQRDDYARRTIKNLWDVPTLFAQIKKHLGLKESHGRAHKLPATIAAQIRQILTISKMWLDKQQEVWNREGEHNVFAYIRNAPPDTYTEEDLENLRAISKLMEDISGESDSNIHTVDQLVKHVEGVLERRAADEQLRKSAGTDGREQRLVDLGGSRRSSRATG